MATCNKCRQYRGLKSKRARQIDGQIHGGMVREKALLYFFLSLHFLLSIAFLSTTSLPLSMCFPFLSFLLLLPYLFIFTLTCIVVQSEHK